MTWNINILFVQFYCAVQCYKNSPPQPTPKAALHTMSKSVPMYLRFPPLPIIRYHVSRYFRIQSSDKEARAVPYTKNVVIYCSFSTHMPHGQSISIGKSQVTEATTRCTNFVHRRKLPAISLKLIDPNLSLLYAEPSTLNTLSFSNQIHVYTIYS